MKRENLDFVIFDQKKEFESKEKLIERDITNQVIKLMKLKMPIVITGVRRCGKSSLLKIVKDKLKLKEKEYFYINFNDERLVDFSVSDFQKIIDYLNENNFEKNCILFLDEIQEVEKWEKWIERIRKKYSIFITGSNSKLLSKEISTILTGRSINVSLYPFSFREYLASKNVKLANWDHDSNAQANIRREFKNYVKSGGFPQRVTTGENIVVSELYRHIIYRDIIGRFNKKLTKQIKEISLYLLSNITSDISLRTLSDISQIKNLSTIKEIVDTFEDAFLFFSTAKFDYSIKKQTQNPKKIYCIDNGFVTTGSFSFSEDKGKLLENLTATELKRRNQEIYYFKNKCECDFIVKKGRKILNAIQVTYSLDEHNKERELRGLAEAMDKYKLKEGMILTSDEDSKINYNGKSMKVLPVWKWILLSN